MPVKRPSPRRIRAIRLSRSSCLTVRGAYPLSRSSRIVLGFVMKAPLAIVGSLCGGTRPLSMGPHAAARRLDLCRGRAHDALMRSSAGAAQWSRLALVTLLGLLVPLAVGVVSDDVWIAALELEADAGLGHPGDEASGARCELLR